MSQPGSEPLLAEFDDRVEELPESVDRSAVERMRVVAYVLDDSIRIPGTDYRVGLDPILGVLPGAGDVLAAGLSMYIVAEAARLGVSYTTLLHLLANVTIDLTVGTIPVVGDVFDAAWKANKRNLELVLEDLREPGTPSGRDGGEVEDETTERVHEIEVTVE